MLLAMPAISVTIGLVLWALKIDDRLAILWWVIGAFQMSLAILAKIERVGGCR